MAGFMTSLWESVFTPGPTPPLLLATNAAFAALQAVLFALLLATHSMHFVVLGILCGALWWAINWFVAELNATEASKRTRDGETPKPRGGETSAADSRGITERDEDAGDEDGADTETEGEDTSSRISLSPVQLRPCSAAGSTSMDSSGHLLARPASRSASEASGVHVEGSSGDEARMRHRGSDMEMNSMTDSEWEKLSDVGVTDATS